ncbi:hypothetical protein ACS5PU_12990 [Pedobacter sp. GSP4]|uniref:hypothetical protein n=1 Tax=Pedobacter sp. GSP4 TaxID=3453716 RepID=UPI003EE82420
MVFSSKLLKYYLLILLLCATSGIFAQVKVHAELRTASWNLIGLKYDKQVKPLVWQAVFPAALRAINNKIIELPGYIIPIKVGNSFTSFMFSIVPIASCPYCGSGDIPEMIEVKAVKAVNWTEKPVVMKGKFIINEADDSKSTFFLIDAVQQ